jgi:hypothetical protein
MKSLDLTSQDASITSTQTSTSSKKRPSGDMYGVIPDDVDDDDDDDDYDYSAKTLPDLEMDILG